MAEFDVDQMIERFKERAEAVRDRPLPPVAGEERKRFLEQAETDYLDYSLVANADWAVEEGKLVLRIPLSGS
jgi:vacuolar-type H+-ATPase subunit H